MLIANDPFQVKTDRRVIILVYSPRLELVFDFRFFTRNENRGWLPRKMRRDEMKSRRSRRKMRMRRMKEAAVWKSRMRTKLMERAKKLGMVIQPCLGSVQEWVNFQFLTLKSFIQGSSPLAWRSMQS